MCGRFVLSDPRQMIEELFGLARIEPFPPRYNIAPTQPVLVVHAVPPRPAGSNLPDRGATLMRWGLLPSWVKAPKDFPLLINARSETAAVKASFRAAMRHRRCIVPANGFYEWRRDRASGRSRAYWVRPPDGGIVGFAGLWETWSDPAGGEIDTCAILTAAAGPDLAFIHERVPVTLRRDDYRRWLDCRTYGPADVADVLASREPGFYEPVPISDRVNKVANDDPAIQERVEPAPFGDPASEAGSNAVAAPAPPDQLNLL